jgi:hypothetical protein
MAKTTTTLEPDVRAILERSEKRGRELYLKDQLDRPTYVKVNKILEVMGGKWNRGTRSHVFEDNAEVVVADALMHGSVTDLKKAFQFYETPARVADSLAREVRYGHSVLEPSAGRGSIVRAIRAREAEPEVCELMPQNRRELEAMGCKVVAEDFLKLPADWRQYDRIVANPPFTRLQDVFHVTKMIGLLAPNGVLRTVMSPAWTFHQSNAVKAFRAILAECDHDWELLPEGTFAESGTMVRTGILEVRR